MDQLISEGNAFQAEEDRIRKEEEEAREHEEYLRLREAFTVDEEGETEQNGDLDVSIFNT